MTICKQEATPHDLNESFHEPEPLHEITKATPEMLISSLKSQQEFRVRLYSLLKAAYKQYMTSGNHGNYEATTLILTNAFNNVNHQCKIINGVFEGIGLKECELMGERLNSLEEQKFKLEIEMLMGKQVDLDAVSQIKKEIMEIMEFFQSELVDLS